MQLVVLRRSSLSTAAPAAPRLRRGPPLCAGSFPEKERSETPTASYVGRPGVGQFVRNRGRQSADLATLRV